MNCLVLHALLLSVSFGVLACGNVLAQTQAKQTEASQAATSQSFTAKQIRGTLVRQAQDYVIKSGKSELTLVKSSLLNWSNVARATEQGVLMVWLDEGMPLAMASMFTYEWRGPRVKHEFISLSDGPLHATYGSDLAWTPNRAGLKWRKFQSTKKDSSLNRVPSSKAHRLSQMRMIAREFKVEMKNAGENRISHLRCMPEPVYRFKSKKHKATDGGIFSFCMATDPEAFFIIRATEGGPEGDAWEYAFVPSINCQLTAYHGKQRVWQRMPIVVENDVLGNETYINDPYSAFHLKERDFTPHPDLEPETIQ